MDDTGVAKQLTSRTAAIDMRAALPATTAPTLVLHHTDDMAAPIEGARYLAEHIPVLALSSSQATSTTRLWATSTWSWTRSKSS